LKKIKKRKRGRKKPRKRKKKTLPQIRPRRRKKTIPGVGCQSKNLWGNGNGGSKKSKLFHTKGL